MTSGQQQDFEALARQFWNAWGQTLRSQASGEAITAGVQAWHEAVDWWTQLARSGRAEANAVVERFNTLARDWYGAAQQVAARFAGQEADAAEIARAWKQALGAVGENPFPEMFRSMRGQGQQGLDQWMEAVSPWLESWQRETRGLLGLPAFGFAREHQERWQKLAQAQLDYQQRLNDYNALMLKAGQRAYEIFELRLAGRGDGAPRIGSARALFDLWVDAVEEAWAEVALSPEYRTVYGALVNAQMRVRAGVQKEVELLCGQFGMPTRTEVDAAHRKITELEREVRRLREALRTATDTPAAAGARKPATARKPAAAPARRKAASSRTGQER